MMKDKSTHDMKNKGDSMQPEVLDFISDVIYYVISDV